MSESRNAWVSRVLGITITAKQDDGDEIRTRLVAAVQRIPKAMTLSASRKESLLALARRAQERLKQGDYAAALAATDELEIAIEAPPIATAPIETRAGVVDYATCRLQWTAAKQSIQAKLQGLEQAILQQYRNTRAFNEIAVKIRKLDTVLDAFAEDLGDLLDRAGNATQAAERQKHHAAAAAVIARFLAHAQTDPFITKIDANPFVPVNARTALTGTLGELSRAIS